MTDHLEFFWLLADPLLQLEDVTRSTMMGFPCLRTDGEFFASVHPESGHLIVKLDAARVAAMIEDGAGEPFAPSGRRFREWVQITDRNPERWALLLEASRSFVRGQ